MTPLDVALQRWRARVALAHVPPGARVLDVGTYDGGLFAAHGLSGVGIDPELAVEPTDGPGQVRLVRGLFPQDLPADVGVFGAVTALAVLEHVPDGELDGWVTALATLLEPGGRLVATVPAPAVDRILHVLMALRLVHGMEAHEHHGFEPADLLGYFAAPVWELERRSRFQLGLNNLFVFRRTG